MSTYTCEKCPKTYKTEGGLKKHMATHVVPETVPATAEVTPTYDAEFREASYTLTKALTLEARQADGIFFTPRKARQRLLDVIKAHTHKTPTHILEPSFGSGEFLLDMAEAYPDAHLWGCEKEPSLFDAVQKVHTNSPRVHLTKGDFREFKVPEATAGCMDLVVGNPPYVVMGEAEKEPACMTGRGNLYVLFIYLCLRDHLREDGLLAFVLPTSFYNAAYYEPCRRYIKNHATVVHVENLTVRYIDTAQDTMLLVIRKRKEGKGDVGNTNPFLYESGDRVYISPDAAKLQDLTRGATTLQALGMAVKTGKVVWNQHKDKLTDKAEAAAVPVLYANNIREDHTIALAVQEMKGGKKQYIKGFTGAEPLTGPAILISRGYGNKYKYMFGVVRDPAFRFYGENHTNVIYATTEAAKDHLKTVEKSLEDPRTAEYIRIFAGNGAISKTELETVLPIFIS